ncbi:uncharacterized protein LOC110990921, partial [Acanthaster planci]|uniref:Uncharacterized protein LOC110990921 n=1 Tax=Acanthaster planci TaxID=133434 RepID=A0A8B8A1S8_ACAPL
LPLDIIGKPASQSSTYEDWTADRAVDGNTATTAHTRVCSGYEWWMVDLEGIYCLTQITIVNRGDCCGERLTGAIVRAGVNSDQSQNTQIGDPVTSTQATDGAVIDFMANLTVSARYVSVESYGNECLQLAEVMVTTETTSSIIDITGKPTSQSSTYLDWSANRAVDGDPDTISHTECPSVQWWKIDLQEIYSLTKITLVNRRDCCGERLEGAIVRAGMNSDQSQNTQIGDPVTSTQATNGAVIDFLANLNVSARYVSVESSRDCLQLAEVMVATDTTGSTINLNGKPASQSSTYVDSSMEWSADRAIDGDPDTASHTDCPSVQWWKVDLQAMYCFTKITIVNRRDCCGERFEGAIVRAGVNSDQSQNTQIGDPVTSTQATDGAVIDFMANLTVSARYVSVESSRDCLQLAEVMVSTKAN